MKPDLGDASSAPEPSDAETTLRGGGGTKLPPPALEEREGDAAAAERAEDHALIRRAQQGDEQAFAALVRRHQARAWRIARNLVAGEEDAADLAQEAFLRVFKNLASFDFDHGFTTWLYRIVTNLTIDHLRKRRPAVSTAGHDEEGDLDLVDPDVERPSDGLEREELGLEVQACLANLAPHFQSVLVLREIEGLPCNEIAHIVGATHVTVRWRLHRARKLFQEEWERRARLSSAGGDLVVRDPQAEELRDTGLETAAKRDLRERANGRRGSSVVERGNEDEFEGRDDGKDQGRRGR